MASDAMAVQTLHAIRAGGQLNDETDIAERAADAENRERKKGREGGGGGGEGNRTAAIFFVQTNFAFVHWLSWCSFLGDIQALI